VCLHIDTCIHIHICICMHTCIHMHTYVCIHTYTHTHADARAHTHTPPTSKERQATIGYSGGAKGLERARRPVSKPLPSLSATNVPASQGLHGLSPFRTGNCALWDVWLPAAERLQQPLFFLFSAQRALFDTGAAQAASPDLKPGRKPLP
jgi:hypothetical protein